MHTDNNYKLSSLSFFLFLSDQNFNNYMQAVYTDVQVSNLAPNHVYPIDAVNMLEAVKNLKDGDARVEEEHKQEAAAGLLQMQENDPKGHKSKSNKKIWPLLPQEK